MSQVHVRDLLLGVLKAIDHQIEETRGVIDVEPVTSLFQEMKANRRTPRLPFEFFRRQPIPAIA